MKYVAVIVVVVALGWFGLNHYVAKSDAALDNSKPAVAPVAKVDKPAPPAPPPAPATSSAVTRPAATTAAPASGPVAVRRPPGTPDPNAPIKIDLTRALGPNNNYYDDVVGLSVALPEGWKVRDAIRWGEGHKQNTVFMRPDVPSSASPSMYYKPYTDEEMLARGNTGAQALLREQAQKKEASRVTGTPDYQNVPDSFSFFDVTGSPAMTYFATFTRGNEVMTEHFIRVLGPRGYVMFFTTGKFEDVKAIMPQLKQAATSVKGP